MFTSIIDTTAGTISIQSAMICIGAALVLGIISALVYMLSAERYSSNFILTMALLPALVQVVILMTSGNLGSAVAVLGTFSLIRFRSAAGTAKELLGIGSDRVRGDHHTGHFAHAVPSHETEFRRKTRR